MIVILVLISNLFDLKGKLINILIIRRKRILNLSLFSLFFFIFSFTIYKKFGSDELQIFNFLLSFIFLFEVCIKIAESDKFIEWIGENIERSIRLLIMFIVCLNCSYFFTRITRGVIDSQGTF